MTTSPIHPAVRIATKPCKGKQPGPSEQPIPPREPNQTNHSDPEKTAPTNIHASISLSLHPHQFPPGPSSATNIQEQQQSAKTSFPISSPPPFHLSSHARTFSKATTESGRLGSTQGTLPVHAWLIPAARQIKPVRSELKRVGTVRFAPPHREGSPHASDFPRALRVVRRAGCALPDLAAPRHASGAEQLVGRRPVKWCWCWRGCVHGEEPRDVPGAPALPFMLCFCVTGRE